MLHSFEYPEAREAFQKAQSIDPDFAMAVWGEAMTHNHPIWMRQDRDAALEALEKLGDSPDAQLQAAPTERERDYLRTLHVLYGVGASDPASKEARDDLYMEAMGDLAGAYPEDLDAQAFYALSILGTAHEGRDFSIYMKSAAVAEEVFDANPKHPGAAHYLIHAYDDPVHAPLGLRPARIYADIAPKASHALHMPSHIFFALGMWDRGAASNVDSYEAERDQAAANDTNLGGGGYHALHWLAYARIQQGRYDDAREVTERALQHVRDTGEEPSGYERYMTSAYPASYIVETKRWEEMADFDIDLSSGYSERLVATTHSVQGMAALYTGDRVAAEKHLQRARAAAESGERERLRIPVLQLQGVMDLDAGNTDAALDALAKAAEMEDEMPLDFGPSWPLKPAHELYGETLLKLGRADEAQKQFQQSLNRYPKRALSLLGLAQAAEQTGDLDTAREAQATLRSIWDNADPDVGARLDTLSAASSASP
jgi:tetratricopeptide (TPR) repeat protein